LELDAGVLVEPAAGLDVDLLAGAQLNLEHVALAADPDDGVAAGRGEGVDEQARAPEQHVAHALDALEAVLEVVGGGQEVMLADVERLSAREVQRDALARPVTREGDPPRTQRLGNEEVESRDLALDAAGQRLQLD